MSLIIAPSRIANDNYKLVMANAVSMLPVIATYLDPATINKIYTLLRKPCPSISLGYLAHFMHNIPACSNIAKLSLSDLLLFSHKEASLATILEFNVGRNIAVYLINNISCILNNRPKINIRLNNKSLLFSSILYLFSSAYSIDIKHICAIAYITDVDTWRFIIDNYSVISFNEIHKSTDTSLLEIDYINMPNLKMRLLIREVIIHNDIPDSSFIMYTGFRLFDFKFIN